MLLSTMNHHEVRIEFMRDLGKIKEATLQRLLNEYYRERKNFRIDPAKEYAKTQTIWPIAVPLIITTSRGFVCSGILRKLT